MKKKIILSVALVLLVVMIATLCVACTPSVDSVANKYDKKGYDVTKTEKTVSAAKAGDEGGLIGAIVNSKAVTITWYDTEEDAQKAYDTAVALFGEKGAKKKGTAVAVGDEDSLKIF
ncbi:MAG: hypothetical protein HDT29_04345 [Clostridiales bacterium]|nr:hypothetical protein [Clostridiales bacterium]